MSISNLHISHNAPCLPAKILHALCFSFLLGIIPVPRETEKHCLCEQFLFWQGEGGWGFWERRRANKVHYGRCARGE